MSFYRDEQFDKLSERWANTIIARERGAAKPKDVAHAFNKMTDYLDARFQAATEAAKATGTAGEREFPSVNRITTQLETAERGFICPLCGKDYPHGHTPAEISIYRNGIKAGIHQKELAGAEHSRAAQNAGMDAGATGAGGRIGSHQRHEHRGRQSGNQRLDCGSDGACDGLPGSGEVREAVAEAARQPAPVSQDAETWLRERYGAAHGHHAWRDLEEAFNAGRAALAATAAPVLSDEQISKMARYLSDFSSAQCGVDKDDAWAIYGNDEIELVRAAFTATRSQP